MPFGKFGKPFGFGKFGKFGKPYAIGFGLPIGVLAGAYDRPIIGGFAKFPPYGVI